MQRILTNSKTQSTFESIKHIDDKGNEYWFARELMPLLEYSDWRNFLNVIKKAKDTIKNSYQQVEDHFVEFTKMIKIAEGTGKEANRSQNDIRLTRLACYAIAQNGDPKKEAIALAQSYFAIQTRKQEVYEERGKAIERINARRKLSETEKKFGGMLSQRGIDGRGIAEIKSAGDEALFGSPTRDVKNMMGIDQSKPLADHLPTITIKAKELAAEMTTFKATKSNLRQKEEIKYEHIDNNAAVRKLLNENGIFPEKLPAEEDIKKLERKFEEIDSFPEDEELRLEGVDTLSISIVGLTDEAKLQLIRKLILENPGDSRLVIYYGTRQEPKIIERRVQINPAIVEQLRKYMVMDFRQ